MFIIILILFLIERSHSLPIFIVFSLDNIFINSARCEVILVTNNSYFGHHTSDSLPQTTINDLILHHAPKRIPGIYHIYGSDLSDSM